jgi:hypothetical protein
MTNVLRATPVKGLDDADAINYDSDQDIIKRTKLEDGKWRFYEGDRLLAEADAPIEPTREILEQWAGAVRARTHRELDQGDIDKRDAARANKTRESNSGIVGADGEPLDSNVPTDTTVVESVEVADTTTIDDDPDAFVDAKIASAEKKIKAIIIKGNELQDLLDELKEEGAALTKDKLKWIKMKEAING